MTFGNRLRQLRKRRGWTQEYLEKHAGVGRKAIGKWENGQATPRLDSLQILAKCFNVTISELLKGVG